jgi:glutathione S-transferase
MDNPHGLILYDHPSSPCARRVRITLLEKGLAWDTQIIDLSRLEQRRPEYLPRLGVALTVQRYPNLTRWHQRIAGRPSTREDPPRREREAAAARSGG